MTPKERIAELERQLTAERTVSDERKAIAADLAPKLDAARAELQTMRGELATAQKERQTYLTCSSARQVEINDVAGLLDGLGIVRKVKPEEPGAWAPDLSLVARVALLAARGIKC